MSTNENAENVIDSQNNGDEVADAEVAAETAETEAEADGEEQKPARPKRTPQEELAYFEGRAARLRKDLGLNDDAAKPQKRQTPSDLAEKAYLAANGIKGTREIEFYQRLKKETGRDAESLLESAYFQTEFSAFREREKSAMATPTASKRSNGAAADSVEYWIAKGELPKDFELRKKVVNAMMKKDDSKGTFYNS